MNILIKPVIALTLAVLALNLLSPNAPHSSTSNRAEAPDQRVPVLVELFTSEGCSDCPPADKLLAQLEASQPVDGAQVIVLSEHVDYWNYIGWTDRFSSPDFTRRQEQYAISFGISSSYTPQMIVDGVHEFVGSDGRKALQNIQNAARNPHAQIKVDGKFSSEIGKNAATSLSIHVTEMPADLREPVEVMLAVTESNLTSSVKDGENKGRTLTHVAVVRKLQKIGEIAKGAPTWDKEQSVTFDNHAWDRTNMKFVVFLQGERSKKVYGASAFH